MDYLDFLPDPPEDCRDPELFRLLNEYHFVRWHSDYESRRDELIRELFTVTMLERAEAGTSDPFEDLRFYCGALLLGARGNEAMPFALKLLADPSEDVRGRIAELLFHLQDARCLEPLRAMAKSDPSPFVRGRAAMGLGGQDPIIAIPVLLEMLDSDHELDESDHTPAEGAATALDEMMETEWTAKRHDADLRSVAPQGVDLNSLKQQAVVYLENCRNRQTPRAPSD